jgi:4-amino-4-deoxy-L-arabinose transferase-like glycosyltransferase
MTGPGSMHDSSQISSRGPGAVWQSAWFPYAAIVALTAALFALRLAAPPNLLDNDQEGPAAYVLDAVKNGQWLCQRNLSGDITSKPPVWTWLSASATLACGRISVFTLYLPGALAAAGVGCLVFAFGRRYFGRRAGYVAAAVSLLTTAGLKGIGLARTDGVFAFTVTAAALLAFRAWMRGRGWTWFWLMATVATLTKGPLGLVLAGGGLLARLWERKSPNALPIRGTQWPGIVLFILLTAGWLGLSYRQFGSKVTGKLLNEELKAQAATRYDNHLPGTMFWQPPLYYLGRAAPWSLLAYYGLWQIARRAKRKPAALGAADSAMSDGLERERFERFLFWWFVAGMVIFSLAPHQRADLLWPLMPAGALIAGYELARLTGRVPEGRFLGCLALVAALASGGFALHYFGHHARAPVVRQTVALKKFAVDLERRVGTEFPLTHFDAPTALQVYLNTLRPQISAARAAALLRGPEPAFVAVLDLTTLEQARQAGDPPLYTLLCADGSNPTRIVANRPSLAAAESSAFCFGPLFFRLHHALLLGATEREFRVALSGPGAEVIVVNESAAPRLVRLYLEQAGRQVRQQRLLGSQEVWTAIPASGNPLP